MKIVEVNQTPHLCTFADRDIAIGEELRYDYGVPTLPWRKATQWLLDLRTARNQDKQHPYTQMYGTKKGNTMTTISTDSQEPGQTTSVHTKEVDETKRVLQIPGEQNKQPKSN
ncbi:uncharacterized protein LOC127867704 isoform X1 [Dreissena polymorpha]|uniref:uncharacterized protein LOC127867704 isoform X1 n=1 Tax=Dreissena polymorpha TaxID=45954 RepID=UPI0022650172|nr:uncharacterized protein LOC127867704 isoform X1 [Dreissena polymorpha]